MHQTEIQAILEKLEKKHKSIYERVILTKLSSKKLEFGLKMLDFIDDMLLDLLPLARFLDFHDSHLVKLLCKAFYGEAAEEGEWNECEAPLFSALLCVYVSDQMIEIFKGWYELEWSDVFEKQKNTFDKKATDLLNACHWDDWDETKKLLGEGYFVKIKKTGKKSAEESRVTSLLELADRSNAHSFLAHPCVQRFVDEIWVNGYPKSSTTTTRKTKAIFFKRPKFIFIFHMLAYCCYTILYGIFLQHLHSIGRGFVHKREDNYVSLCACGLTLWQLAMIWETFVVEVEPVERTYRQQWWDYHKYTFFHLFFVTAAFLFFAGAHLVVLFEDKFEHNLFELRQSLVVLYEFLFYWNFIYTSIRLLLILTIFSFYGTIIFTIKNMLQTFLNFLPVVIFFWLVYSTVQISLIDITLEKNFLWSIFIHGSFELVQDTQSTTKLGKVLTVGRLHCENITEYDTTGLAAQCWLRRGMAPVILFCYVLMASVLVINILTTMINKQYDDANLRASNHWNSLKLRRTLLYQKKHFPPPVNILIDFLTALIGRRLSKLRVPKKANEDYYYGISFRLDRSGLFWLQVLIRNSAENLPLRASAMNQGVNLAESERRANANALRTFEAKNLKELLATQSQFEAQDRLREARRRRSE